MIKAELKEVDFENNRMAFKFDDSIIAQKGKYVLIEESEFERLSKPSYVSGGGIPTKLVVSSRDINLPLGCCNLKGKVAFNQLDSMDDKAIKNKQSDEFREKVKPLIKYLNDNHHPHTSIIITPTSAQLLEGLQVECTNEFIND